MIITNYHPVAIRKYGIKRVFSFFEHIFIYNFSIKAAIIASRMDIIPAWTMEIK